MSCADDVANGVGMVQAKYLANRQSTRNFR